MGPRLTALLAALAVLVALAGCSSDDGADADVGKLSTYDLAAGEAQYALRVALDGRANAEGLGSVMGGTDGEIPVDVVVEADITGTVTPGDDGFTLALEAKSVSGDVDFSTDDGSGRQRIEQAVAPDGEIRSVDGEGLAAQLPVIASGIGFACPVLPEGGASPGDSWDGEAKLAFPGAQAQSVPVKNSYEVDEGDDGDVAVLRSEADTDIRFTADLGPLAAVLGINLSVLDGVKATVEGRFEVVTGCNLGDGGTRLDATSAKGKIALTLDVEPGAGGGIIDVAGLVDGAEIDVAVTSSMKRAAS